METLLWILHFITAITLVVAILLQPGQSGGMGTAFGGGGSQTLFGSQGSTGFLGKLTAALGALFFLTSLSLAVLSRSGEESLMQPRAGAPGQQEGQPKAPGQGSGLKVPTVPEPPDQGQKSPSAPEQKPGPPPGQQRDADIPSAPGGLPPKGSGAGE